LSSTFAMSSRRPRDTTSSETAHRLRTELQALKSQAQQVEVAGTLAETSSPTMEASAFDSLSGPEQAAGSLGVHPEAWKPIKFMNNKHYEQLIASNSLDDNLARRIEAFRHVATNA
jgi:hypothetical protein